MPVAKLDLHLCPENLAELHASTLEYATIRAARIYTENDTSKLARLLNYEVAPPFSGGAMVLPHFDSDGNKNCHVTVKPHQPRINDKGKAVKYEAPIGKPPQAYVGPASRKRIKAGAREIIFVEGIKKALALEQLGYTVISLSGVWNWKVKDEDKLQPDLESIAWAGLKVFVLFDYDPKPTTQRNVATAARRLGRLLLDASAAVVRVTALPPGPDNAKNGIDDHLATLPAEQRAAAMQKLLDGAKGLEETTVVVGTDEHRVSDETEAILAANTSNLYQRGRQLVQVLQHATAVEGEDKHRVRRSDGAPIVRTIPSPIVLLDNVSDALGNDVLDRALTATHWKDRILGGNSQYDGPLNATWYATSNNAYIVGDTTRRVLPIRLVSLEEHPEERTGFKYPELRKHILENRGLLLSHALTILRAYCQAGRPPQKLNPWRGSFEGWTDLVRAAVVWLGMPDPADTREDIRQGTSPEQIALTALYAGIQALDLAGRGLTAAAIIDHAARSMGNRTVKAMLEALPVLCPSKDRSGVLPSAISLGKRLHNLKDRVVDGRILEQLPETRAGALWRVIRCGDSGGSSPRFDCGDSGDSGDVLPENQTDSRRHWTYPPGWGPEGPD